MVATHTAQIKASSRIYPWLVLLTFQGAVILTQVFWYNFAPLLSQLVSKYRISELSASWTILVFPLASILFSGHAGALIDRRGYRFSTLAGLTLMSVSALLRIFDQSFWLLLIGQAGIAISVPYIVTCISKLVTDWFDPAREAFYTSICTIGIFVGMALSLAASPLLVGFLTFRGAMAVLAALAVMTAVIFKLVVRENRPVAAAALTTAPHDVSVLALLKNRNIVVIFIGAFLGQGCFNALTDWMEVIWHERGFSSDAAGIAGGVLIVGGIFGSLAIPPMLDKFNYPRLLLWIGLAPGMLLLSPFLAASSPRSGYVWGFVLGFFWLSSLAISLTLLERSAHKEHSGAASGLFWTIGNAGALGLPILFERIKDATNWRTSINVLILMLVLMNVSIAWLRAPAKNPAGD